MSESKEVFVQLHIAIWPFLQQVVKASAIVLQGVPTSFRMEVLSENLQESRSKNFEIFVKKIRQIEARSVPIS